MARRPVGEVFEAFVDPKVTTRFCFSKGSGRLVQGRRIRWEWAMLFIGAAAHRSGWLELEAAVG